MLAQEDVAQYLLDRGLLGPEAVLDGDLAIRDASSRNRNFRVETREGPGYMLKQGLTQEAVATVAHEAGVYHRLSDRGHALNGHIPRFCGYDPTSGVLALELVRDAEDLRTLHLRTGQFSAGPSAILGSALGQLHSATAIPAAEPTPAMAPWILWVHQPDARVFRDISAAGLELVRIVQSSAGFPGALDDLRADWTPSALTHGDVKWDNCLVTSGEDGSEELRLIDWESASTGDPGWDIGSALSHYLSFWLFSIPVTGAVPPERFPELAQYPLDSMKPALAACWIAYAEERGLARASAADELVRAVRFAGARLVQTAFEAAQMSQQLTSAIVLHLQLALNVLTRADEAATMLLGIPMTASRAA